MSSLVIRNAVIIPVDPPGVIYAPGWVRVEGARIVGLGQGEAPPGPVGRVIDARGGLVMPGLVSTHQHLLDVLLRGGVRAGPTFLDWLLGLYYAGMSVYTPADAGLATMLAAVETVRAGVTTVVDNWGVDGGDSAARVRECAEASIASFAKSGLRVLFARMFATRLPNAWTAAKVNYDLSRLTVPLDDALTAIDELMSSHQLRHSGRIRVCPSPELPEMVESEGLAMAMDLARAHDMIMPMHLLASPESRALFDANRLEELGALGPALLGAHCTAATPGDIAVLAAHDVKIAHCPTSNSFRGRIAPIASMLEAGMTIGLGSDNATVNCNSDILAETRRAVLTSRLAGANFDAVTAEKAVEMATIDGACAIGLGDEIGSLTPGKCADIIIIDTSAPHWWPRHNWLTTLVFQAKSTDVRTVVIDGDVVMDDKTLTFLSPDDEENLCREAQRASLAILERAGLA